MNIKEFAQFTRQLGACLPQLELGGGSKTAFGYNWTHPGEPLAHPFTYFDSSQLGSNPEGITSAYIPAQQYVHELLAELLAVDDRLGELYQLLQ